MKWFYGETYEIKEAYWNSLYPRGALYVMPSPKKWIVFFPYYPRFLSQVLAFVRRSFWLPCPICNKKFAGHEWYNVSLKGNDYSGVGVCPLCIQTAKHYNRLSNVTDKNPSEVSAPYTQVW
jgi:hypothetical protein